MDTLDKIELTMQKAHEYYKDINLDARSRKVMESAFVDGYVSALNSATLTPKTDCKKNLQGDLDGQTLSIAKPRLFAN